MSSLSMSVVLRGAGRSFRETTTDKCMKERIIEYILFEKLGALGVRSYMWQMLAKLRQF
jgi:hypothetical protein